MEVGCRVSAFLDVKCLSFKKLTFGITLNSTILGLVFKGGLPSGGESQSVRHVLDVSPLTPLINECFQLGFETVK